MRIVRVCVTVTAAFLASCDGTVLPRFDGGILNPEFRFLRAGDVMKGVKCAMVGFLSEREKELMARREHDQGSFAAIEAKNAGIIYNPYTLNRTAAHLECGLEEHDEGGKCVRNECNTSLGITVWDYKKIFGKTGGDIKKERGCVPVPDYSRFALDANESAEATFTLTGTNSGFVNFARIDATKIESLYPRIITAGGGPTSNPFPQLMPTLKGTTEFEIAARIPQTLHQPPPALPLRRYSTYQYSRALSRADVAKTDRALGTNSPEVKALVSELKTHKTAAVPELKQIAAKLPDLTNVQELKPADLGVKNLQMAVKNASDAKAQASEPPLPVDLAIKDSENLDLIQQEVSDLKETVKSSQTEDEAKNSVVRIKHIASQIKEPNLRDEVRKAIAPVVNAGKPSRRTEVLSDEGDLGTYSNLAKAAAAAPAAPPHSPGTAPSPTPVSGVPIAQNPSPSTLTKPLPDSGKGTLIETECLASGHGYRVDGTTYIDYLALKKMLHNVVNEQDNALPRDAQPITMKTLTLTTTFQMGLEVQGGINLFHFVPVLSAPNGEFKADHMHRLKIVLNGVKGKGDPNYSDKLVNSCRERLQRQVGGGEADASCASLSGIMLEAIIESLETSARSSAGSGG